jgi:hypothetical protein
MLCVNGYVKADVIEVHALVVYGYEVQTAILPIDMRDKFGDLALKFWRVCQRRGRHLQTVFVILGVVIG